MSENTISPWEREGKTNILYSRESTLSVTYIPNFYQTLECDIP